MAFYKNFTHSSHVWTDGTAMTALTHTLDTEQGNMQIGGVKPGLRNVGIYQRKGQVVSIAYEDRALPTASITANLSIWTDSSSGTALDFLLAAAGGPYASRASTLAPSGATAANVPFTFDWAVTIEGTNFGDSADLSGTLTDFLITEIAPLAEGSPSTLNFSGECLGDLTGDFAEAVAT